MVVENAFGRLKGRWRCLLKCLDCKLENVGKTVASCVVLRNMCEMFGDNFLQEWNHIEDSLTSSPQTRCTQLGSDGMYAKNV